MTGLVIAGLVVVGLLLLVVLTEPQSSGLGIIREVPPPRGSTGPPEPYDD